MQKSSVNVTCIPVDFSFESENLPIDDDKLKTLVHNFPRSGDLVRRKQAEVSRILNVAQSWNRLESAERVCIV